MKQMFISRYILIIFANKCFIIMNLLMIGNHFKSSNCFFQLSRSKLVFQEVIRGDYTHRYQIKKSLSSPNFDVELRNIPSPKYSPRQ